MTAEHGLEEEAEEGEEEPKAEEEEIGGAGLLLPIEVLLSTGIHIGTRMSMKAMEQFVYRIRSDGLCVLDVKQTDERIRTAAKFIARFEPSRVVAVSARLYGRTPVQRFCEVIKAVPVMGRFLPGRFSNPTNMNYVDPHVVIVTDPAADRQAMTEAALVGVPVIALCDTDNSLSNVDLVIPANNKGRKALATVYWLLAQQVLRERGELSSDEALSIPIEDFETKLVEPIEEAYEQEKGTLE